MNGIERQLLTDVAWGIIALCLWVPLVPLAQRLRLPGVVGIAAASWLIARLLIMAMLTRRW